MQILLNGSQAICQIGNNLSSLMGYALRFYLCNMVYHRGAY